MRKDKLEKIVRVIFNSWKTEELGQIFNNFTKKEKEFFLRDSIEETVKELERILKNSKPIGDYEEISPRVITNYFQRKYRMVVRKSGDKYYIEILLDYLGDGTIGIVEEMIAIKDGLVMVSFSGEKPGLMYIKKKLLFGYKVEEYGKVILPPDYIIYIEKGKAYIARVKL